MGGRLTFSPSWIWDGISPRNVVQFEVVLKNYSKLWFACTCQVAAWLCCAVHCILVTSAEEGGYVFTSVCLSVCPSHNWKSCERVLTKFLGGVGHGPGSKGINFGDDPDHRPDLVVQSPKSGFTGLSKKYLVDSDQSCIANLHCKNPSAIQLCWRSAEVCALLSTSSCYWNKHNRCRSDVENWR